MGFVAEHQRVTHPGGEGLESGAWSRRALFDVASGGSSLIDGIARLHARRNESQRDRDNKHERGDDRTSHRQPNTNIIESIHCECHEDLLE